MATTTTNLGLTKPASSDPADITVINGNMDLIDAFAGAFLNRVYPVGSIYMSTTSTSPATLFGGTWEQIEDTFLLAAGQLHMAGESDGAETHTHATSGHVLTVEEIPQHYHTFVDYWNTASGSGTKRHAPAVNGDGGGISSADRNNRGRTTGVIFSTSNLGERSGSNIGQAHTHGDTVAASNMPPYLAVYVWKRTA